MKNAMKKLMAFALVAVMLVAAVPFQAFAATGEPITMKIKDVNGNVTDPISRVPGNGESASIDAILTNWAKLDSSDFEHAYISGDGTNKGTVTDSSLLVEAGQSVTIKVNVEVVEIEIIDKDEDKEEEKDDTKEDIKDEDNKQEEQVENKLIKFQIRFDDSDKVAYTKIATPQNGASTTVKNLLTYWYDADWNDKYTFSHAYSSNEGETYSDINTTVYVDDTITIRLKSIKVEDEKEPEVQQPSNDGNANTNPSTNSGQVNSSYNKFPYNVYLNIYNDTKLGSAEKVIKINDTAAEDGKVTLKEVKSIVKKYYNAIDSDTGIKYDGLYLAMGNWSNDYIWDVKDDVIDDIDEMRNQSTVYINVMIDNAKLASSSTADSSNPKTGDNIFMAVSVMTLSASALAVFFFLNKKRAL